MTDIIINKLIEIENDAKVISKQKEQDQQFLSLVSDTIHQEIKLKIEMIKNKEIENIKQINESENQTHVSKSQDKMKKIETDIKAKFESEKDKILNNALTQILSSVFVNTNSNDKIKSDS